MYKILFPVVCIFTTIKQAHGSALWAESEFFNGKVYMTEIKKGCETGYCWEAGNELDQPRGDQLHKEFKGEY